MCVCASIESTGPDERQELESNSIPFLATIANDDHAIADLHTPAPVHISSLFPTTTSNQHQGGLNGIMNTVYPASKSSKSEQLRLSAPPPPPPPQPPQPLSTAPVVEKVSLFESPPPPIRYSKLSVGSGRGRVSRAQSNVVPRQLTRQ